MQRYIAFISGLPVGRNAVKPETIQHLFQRLGFLDVQTFPSTDTVGFETAPVGVIGPLEAQISRHLRRSLDVEGIWTFIRTPKEIAEIVRDIPFASDDVNSEGNSLFVVLIAEEPDAHTAKQLRIRRSEVDELRVAGKEIYWLRRPSDDPVAPPPLSEILGVHATVRSLHTMMRLADKYTSTARPKRTVSGGDTTESERSRP